MRLRSPLWGYVVFVIGVFILAILIPMLSKARVVAQRIICKNNLETLSKAMLVYAGDYDEKYPIPVEQWCDLLIEKADVSPQSFRCPQDSQGSFSYAVNKNVYEIEPAKMPAQLVVLFEANLGRNGVGGPEDLVLRHSDKIDFIDGQGRCGCNIGFADSHTEFVTEDRIADLQWTAE